MKTPLIISLCALPLLAAAIARSQTTIANNQALSGPQTGDFTVPSGISFSTADGTTFSGGTTTFNGYDTAYLTGALSLAAGATWSLTNGYNDIGSSSPAGQVTLTNQGTIAAAANASGGSSNAIYGGGYGNYLTVDNQGTISASGNSNGGASIQLGASNSDLVINEAGANITANSGGQIYLDGALTNNGQITATGSGASVQLDGTWTNHGTLTAANNGVVDLGGTFSNANIGTVVLQNGGAANLTGTLNNSGSLTAPSGGAFTLLGGTINGGTVDGSVLTIANGTLENLTTTGTLNLGGGTRTYLGGNVAIAAGATWSLTNGYNDIGSSSPAGQVTLTNQGTIAAAANASGGSSNAIYGGGYGNYLTVDNQGTISASGNSNGGASIQLGASNSDLVINEAGANITANSGGQIYLDGALTNNGQITATGSGASVQLDGTWTNHGTLTAANNGVVDLGGTFSNANIGTVVLQNGGAANLTGTLNNSGSLTAPSGGAFTLLGGTINGGTVDGSVLTIANGTLENLTTTGTLNLGGGTRTYLGGNVAIAAGATWSLTNGYNDIGSSSPAGQVTLTNQGTIAAAANASGGSSNAIYGGGYGNYLTVDNQGTISASGNSNGGASIQLGASNSDLVINEAGANITANSGGQIYLDGALTNNGQITATGSGASVQLDGTWTNHGTLTAANNGVVDLGGTFSNANIGTVVLQNGGAANLTGTLNNSGSLTAPSGGAFTLLGGTINGGTVDGSVLTIANGTLENLTTTGTLNLGGGTRTYLGGNVAIAAGATWSLTNGYNDIGSSSPAGQVTLTNQGTIAAAANASGGSSNAIYGGGYGNYLTVDNQGTISASGNSNGGASIQLGASNSDLVINEAGANITANSGGQIYLDGALTNNGSLASNGGAILVGGNLTNFADGELSGGTYQVNVTDGAASMRLNLNGNNGTGQITANGANIELYGSGATIRDEQGNNALAGLQQNSGDLELHSGAGLATSGDFANSGSVAVEGGSTLTVAGEYLQNSAQAITYVDAGSSLDAQHMELDGGTLDVAGTLDPLSVHVGAGGILDGSGTVDGDVTNDGGVALGDPSGSIFTIAGDYSQSSSGSMFDNVGSSGSDLLQVSDDVSLGGTLDVDFLDGFTGAGSDQFALINAGELTGKFATVDGLGAGWSVVYGSDYVDLDYSAPVITPPTQGVPEPGDWADLVFLGLIVLAGPAIRRRYSF